jgi:di/tricarboxylate transporter
VAALLIAVSLGIAQFLGMGVLGPPNTPDNAILAISGLGKPVVVTLISLFIITSCLDKYGVTRWLALRLLAMGGKSERRLIALFTITAALLSLFMNNLAAGALLLPSAMDAARRTGIKPSKLLMPVAYGTLLGGAATYFTTANIIVSGLLTAANPPQAPLGVLDFTPTGGLIALAGIVFIIFLGPRLLPDRETPDEQPRRSQSRRELEEAYQLRERLWQLTILPGSSLIGKILAQSGIGEQLGITVAAICHEGQTTLAPTLERVLQQDDNLLVVGREDRVRQLAAQGVAIADHAPGRNLESSAIALVEVVLAPRSRAEGHSLRDLQFRTEHGFTAIALWQRGQNYRTDIGDFKLHQGDSLLMVGPRSRLKALRSTRDFLVLETETRVLEPGKVALTVGITLGALLLSILGAPVYLAMLGGAVLIFLVGLFSPEEAYRVIEWRAIFLIAGMYSVSTAMVQTGLAQVVGQVVINVVAPFGALGLAAGIYLLTTALVQIMGGQVAALVTGPIAISAALHLNINPQAMAVVTAIACSASFLTPIAHPVNILMIGPANYKFGDFFRLGWGLTLLSFAALLVGLKLFWRL